MQSVKTIQRLVSKQQIIASNPNFGQNLWNQTQLMWRIKKTPAIDRANQTKYILSTPGYEKKFYIPI